MSLASADLRKKEFDITTILYERFSYYRNY